MKILISGATGCIGSNLIDYLLSNTEDKLYAIKRPRTDPYRGDKVTYYDCDISDSIGVLNVLQEVKPDKIFHLAAQSFPKISVSNPLYTMDVNVNGTINLLEGILKLDYIPKKILIASSTAIYGKQDKYPVREDSFFNPLSLYATSKATQDLLAYQYYENYKLPIIRMRFGITVQKNQNENNAINSFAKQIALIEQGKKEYLEVGNLTTSRDITDCKDTVRAMVQLSELGENGEAYNICSNVPINMEDILKQLLELSTKKDIVVKLDKSKLRASDIPLELFSHDKLTQLCGWQPQIPFEDTLLEILEYWRSKTCLM